jgi:hypothetical protein
MEKNDKKQKQPEEMKSKYVHDKRDSVEKLEERLKDSDNQNFMKTFDMDNLSKMWDNIINFRMKKR